MPEYSQVEYPNLKIIHNEYMQKYRKGVLMWTNYDYEDYAIVLI